MQYYLITNIDTVTLTGGTADAYGSTDVHLHASAIVLLREDRPVSVRQKTPCRIRVFGPDPSWPVMELATTTIKHKITPIPCPVPGAIQISYALVVERWNLKLVTESHDGAPPHVIEYPDGTQIENVWQDLREKVAEHWNGPNMPVLQWAPAEYVRLLHKETTR